ncbi:MAG: gliding motility-associated C-terminal domain-containing protein [Crocinitomicaceae bacterium]|nr:gliding motility-associated C-terminal domain-containing protein [Crocinitomicaceae bacterium]
MKKWFTTLCLISTFQISFGQDDAAMAAPLGTIMAPATGCALTNSEAVTIRIFNSGPGTINAPFDVSFNITGPINSSATETVLVGSIPMNSTLTYTFTATADLSTAGVYTMDATVTVAGDPNATNDTYTGYSITNNAASNGGTANGSTNVCYNSNSGNINLTGNVGNVLNWEYSDDGGITWINISNTSTSQSYSNLTSNTSFRANIQNSTCPVSTSSTANITIDPVSVGGSTSGGTSPACTGINSGTITLSGHTGSVTHWEYSTDGGVTWTVVANTTTTYNYTNLTTSTRFRASVKSGACTPTYSGQRLITIHQNTVGGNVNPNPTVCSGSNAGVLGLTGHTGSVIKWQTSTNGGVTWSDIVNLTPSQSYLNLTLTSQYRVVVQNGVCPSTNSSIATVTVVPNTVPGTLSSSATICEGVNNDTLVLSGFTGTILDWENSIDGGATWTSMSYSNDSLEYTNILAPTSYRVAVQSASCAILYSTIATLTTDATSIGGTISSNATECASGNSGIVNLSGQTGTPSSWESSTDGGLTWSTIANTSTSQSYLNLLDTTLYRAVVQNGTCASSYSDTVTISVDPVTAGGTINSNTTVCAGNNSGTLTLTGETGSVLNWESSADGGFTWVGIANTTTSQGYLNIATNTLYRAVVQSGICPSTQSGIVTLTVDQAASAGNILGATTVCEGTNSGSLTLVGTSGSIMDWETSTDGGTTWAPVGNTTVIENFTNLIATTDYRAIAVNGVCPNDTSATATITVDALTIGGAVSTDSIVCELANSDILSLAGHTGSVLNWEMSTDGGSTWITLGNTTTFQNYLNLNTTTSYRAVVKNGVCASAASTPATISVNPATVAGAVTSSATVCEGLNFGVLTLAGHTGLILDWESSDDYGATWTSLSNSTINQTYTNLTDTTWYRAIIQNGICPQDTSSEAFINLYPAPVADFVQDTICTGNALNFVNNSTSSTGFITLHSWDFGDGNTSTLTNPGHTYSAAGSYSASLFVMNNFGCSDTATHLMQVDASPIATLAAGSSTTFCEGDSVQIGAILDPNYTYMWNVGSVSNSITVDSAYMYLITVTDITNNCTAQDSIEVIVFAAPVADAGLDTSVALGYSTVLTGSGGTSFTWLPITGLDNPFNPNPSASPVTTTVYTLTVTDDNGCTASDSVTVSISDEVIIQVYDIITPNGDNFNDVFFINNIDNFSNAVTIYNRYGQEVFSTTDYNNGTNNWDGTRNGDNVADGAYYYVIEIVSTGDVFKGTVNVVRSAK